MDELWEDLRQELRLDIGGLEFRQYAVIEFMAGLDPNPYAQVAREANGDWYCEVVSAHFLPARAWPIDELALVAGGWEPPDDPRANWSIAAATGEQAVDLLVEALRHGRACADPETFTWFTGQFPPPPDDGQREPVLPPGPFGLAA